MVNDRFAEAEISYIKLIKLNPNNADAYNNLGLALHGLRRLDEAEKSFNIKT